MKTALCIGINDYEGVDADLAGCVNDAEDWAEFLRWRRFTTATLLDKEATAAVIRDRLAALVASLGPDDHGVFTYSGHGTWVPDENRDEEDGRDEAFVGSDQELLLDDDVHTLLRSLHPAAKLTLITDCCHAGTITRASGPPRARRRIRFLPPALLRPAMTHQEHVSPPSRWLRRMARAMISRSNVVHLTASQDTEYACDAEFNGRPNGAYTFYALADLKTADSSLTPMQLAQKLRAHLPSWDYPQRPGVWASNSNLLRQPIF